MLDERPGTRTTNEIIDWIQEETWPASVEDSTVLLEVQNRLRMYRRDHNDNQEADDIMRLLLRRVGACVPGWRPMTSSDDDRRSALDAALHEGRAKLRALDLDSSTRSWARLEMRRRNGRDPDKTIESLGRLARELGDLQAVVQSVYERGIEAELGEAARLPYQQAWLSNRRRQLARFDDPAQWTKTWLDYWMAAVADGALEAALTIVEWRGPVGDNRLGLRDEMGSITHELRAGTTPDDQRCRRASWFKALVSQYIDSALRAKGAHASAAAQQSP